MAIYSEFMEDIPSGYVKIAIENGPVEIVDVPIKDRDLINPPYQWPVHWWFLEPIFGPWLNKPM